MYLRQTILFLAHTTNSTISWYIAHKTCTDTHTSNYMGDNRGGMSKSPLTLSIVHSTNGKEKEKEWKSPQHIVSLLPESWWCTHTTRRVCMCVCLPLGRPQTFYVNKQYHLRFWLVWFPYELKSLLKTIPSRAIEKERKKKRLERMKESELKVHSIFIENKRGKVGEATDTPNNFLLLAWAVLRTIRMPRWVL